VSEDRTTHIGLVEKEIFSTHIGEFFFFFLCKRFTRGHMCKKYY